jgi:hypothetical protein
MNSTTNATPSATPSIDIIYEALCRTCDILDTLGCKYFISGGTLLGAKREGDLIAHDSDFDLDCLSEEKSLILGAEELFEKQGLKIIEKMSRHPQRLFSLEKTNLPLCNNSIRVYFMGYQVGDILLYTFFDDGIARRFDLQSGMYTNAKMSIPDWFFSGEEYLFIRGRKFRSVRAPEIVLEKVYGPDWHTPLKPGQYVSGRHQRSGSVPDASIEKLMLYALANGWSGMRADAPVWPQEVKWVGYPTDISREWIFRHEPLLHEQVASFIKNEATVALAEGGNAGYAMILGRLIATIAIQSERDRFQARNGRPVTELSWIKRVFFSKLKSVLKILPSQWRISVWNWFASIYGRY